MRARSGARQRDLVVRLRSLPPPRPPRLRSPRSSRLRSRGERGSYLSHIAARLAFSSEVSSMSSRPKTRNRSSGVCRTVSGGGPVSSLHTPACSLSPEAQTDVAAIGAITPASAKLHVASTPRLLTGAGSWPPSCGLLWRDEDFRATPCVKGWQWSSISWACSSGSDRWWMNPDRLRGRCTF
jgi:hypothetical protein